jgi:micrococcal nuclease
MRKFILLILIATSLVSCSQSYTVGKVVDGDTFIIMYRGQQTKVRLIGVDTPEAYDYKNVREELGGKEASAYTRSLIEGKQVTLEFDHVMYDKYNRLLAYVYLSDGRMLNALLVEKGYAEPARYEPNTKYADYFESLND